MTAASALVRIERHRDIALVILSRPHKRNALTPDMFAQLRAALADAADSAGLVLAGDGPVFCGGFDLALCLADDSAPARLLQDLSLTLLDLSARDHPVVIAAHGAAIAGGAALLGAADTVIGTHGASYGYPVLRLGLSPAVSYPFLRAHVGDGPARRLLLDTALIDADEALCIGLVHRLTDPADCLPAALETCRVLAAKPPHAFAATKRLLRDITAVEAAAPRALAASLATAASPESRDRLRALFAATAAPSQ